MMNPKEISLEAIIWAAKEIAKENQVNAAYLMGYAQAMMDAEKQENNRLNGGAHEERKADQGARYPDENLSEDMGSGRGVTEKDRSRLRPDTRSRA